MTVRSTAGGILLAIAIIFVILVVIGAAISYHTYVGKQAAPGGYKDIKKAPFELGVTDKGEVYVK